MSGPGRMKKVTKKAFLEDAGGFLDGVGEAGRPLLITVGGRPAAVLADADTYEDCMRRLRGYERIFSELEKPEKARMTAHAKAMSELRRKGRKV